jgi:hypothetical protein
MKLREPSEPPELTSDQARRIQSAQVEFQRLLQRHRVVYMVEQGTNSATGAFTRIVFGIEIPKATPDPSASPAPTP